MARHHLRVSTKLAAAVGVAALLLTGCGGSHETGVDDNTSTPTPHSPAPARTEPSEQPADSPSEEASPSSAPAQEGSLCSGAPIEALADTIKVEFGSPENLTEGMCRIDADDEASLVLWLRPTAGAGDLAERMKLARMRGDSKPKSLKIDGSEAMLLDASKDGRVALVADLDQGQLSVSLVDMRVILGSGEPSPEMASAVVALAEALADAQ